MYERKGVRKCVCERERVCVCTGSVLLRVGEEQLSMY
jgi:hypothetical protein